MNPEQYSEAEQKDIEERIEKAKMALADLKLQPSAQVYKINMGDDTFADKIVPYLQDTKYQSIPSPIQP